MSFTGFSRTSSQMMLITTMACNAEFQKIHASLSHFFLPSSISLSQHSFFCLPCTTSQHLGS
ncbi:hypothetical protein B0H19DRAFT_1148378 [Mycena capillaripes]|nr:hypothetical protein B0H19DRAFT_1148378 [Mycena capillaripes]